MNIPKAIKTVNETPYLVTAQESSDFKEAISLLIEAGKGIVSLRKGHGKALSELLPGETKD